MPTNPIPGGYLACISVLDTLFAGCRVYIRLSFLKRIATLGIVGWLFGAVAALAGYVRSDPSYLWLFCFDRNFPCF